MTISADDVIAAARACVGAPFRHQGRSLETGIDCAGLAILVCQGLGLDVCDVSGYGRVPANGQLEAALSAQAHLSQRAEASDRQPGDLLLMRFVVEPQHLAILTAEGTIVHAYESAGICCEHLLDDCWASRIVAAYAFDLEAG